MTYVVFLPPPCGNPQHDHREMAGRTTNSQSAERQGMYPSAVQATSFLTAQSEQNTIVTSMTILILEYFEHFELERTLIWKSRWNVCKCLFLASRYLPFVFVAGWLYYSAAPGSTSPEDCRILYVIATIFMILGSLCADAVLYLRIHALSMHSRSMKTILGMNYAVVALLCFATIPFFLRAQTFVPSPDLLSLTSCFGISAKGPSHWVLACYGGLLYSSIFTMALSLWYGVQLYLSLHPTPGRFVLVKIFYIDGAFYFLFIAVMSTANILVALLAPSQFRYLLSNPQAVAHCVLATRMILHLRQVARVSLVEFNPDSRLDAALQSTPWAASFSLSGFKTALPHESDIESRDSGSSGGI
ncbi:hypothetical protein BKA70DRAFT_1436152 [Coprinopsis sp. MPI-PUGE-AT-0042]|nr:hypothetical protein BKA70DRAFT_1436152 [Coprinopsis sp. MPI-PUGE-AT-0042]